MRNNRRLLLKSGIALSLTGYALPKEWTQPFVKAVVIPVHAQTSGGPATQCNLGFITEPVSEPIVITISGVEVRGPIVGNLTANVFDVTQTSSLGLCSNNVDELTETIEFSGTLDSTQNTIAGDLVIRQFCAGVLACEQITAYTVTQSVISAQNDGEYQGTLSGTLRCCQV